MVHKNSSVYISLNVLSNVSCYGEVILYLIAANISPLQLHLLNKSQIKLFDT